MKIISIKVMDQKMMNLFNKYNQNQFKISFYNNYKFLLNKCLKKVNNK